MPIEPVPVRIGPSSVGLGSVGIARAIGAVDPKAIRTAAGGTGQSNGIARHVGPVSHNEPLDVGPMPVNAERVGEIRRAIESGRYPLVPARVADAMIAAGLLLRSAK